MKIAYFSNVLGLRDILDLPAIDFFEDDFNHSLDLLLAEFLRQGATMTVCFMNDDGSIEWRDYENGVMIGQEFTVICYDTVPHFVTVSV